MQLDACLRSLAENAPYIETPQVLYKATSPEYAQGYAVVADEHDADLVPERGLFSDGARALLLGCLEEHVLMLCDDSITYLPLPADPVNVMEPDVICFSLRLGANTTYCYPRDIDHGVPHFTPRGPFLTWGWRDAPDGDLFHWQGKEGDFGYPYSLDGAVHRRDSLLEWSQGAAGNPNQMEGYVVAAIGQRKDLPPRMASYPLSVQVGLPLNVVNTTHSNRVGLTYPRDPQELNARFLDGERIRYERMDFDNVIGAHQELELVIA